jgi:hypothetical protein
MYSDLFLDPHLDPKHFWKWIKILYTDIFELEIQIYWLQAAKDNVQLKPVLLYPFPPPQFFKHENWAMLELCQSVH